MKLSVSLFLIISHLFSTVGFSMEVHECGTERSYAIYGISLTSLCCCDHESEDHTKDCCTDKKTVVKGEFKEKISLKVFPSKQLIEPLEIPRSSFSINIDHEPVQTIVPLLGAEYPPGSSPPLYVLYRVFLI